MRKICTIYWPEVISNKDLKEKYPRKLITKVLTDRPLTGNQKGGQIEPGTVPGCDQLIPHNEIN